MVASGRAWELEQNDRRIVFSTGPEATLFAETRAFGVTRHCHPAWKVVLPIGGHVEVGADGGRTAAAAGVIVPPQLAHTCATTSSYAALFIDPWVLRPELGLTLLDQATTRRILGALGALGVAGALTAGADLGAAKAELTKFTKFTKFTGLAGAGHPLDPRVAYALRESTRADPRADIGAIAADVGLSPPRLRTLVRASVGIPLVRLRQWARLREAIADLPGESVAAAAASAGFSDQAHLARTARRLIGRAPASISRYTP
ncbi:helix-turn-helix domain-containing protein [Streptomyces endophyticus]|uniref:Helix-turn-helix domain-containing protein n=1 Tax=Streptomyces endophyticus TaxID=714166 RepID=A0ABU6FIC2_9ACTN|nr:helix-turn-helix domain-containing protein [Streptomyces endophyticus]MEB8343806.1 helix-turn-helix domain-containing protein [Streptomyces endophyticus]